MLRLMAKRYQNPTDQRGAFSSTARGTFAALISVATFLTSVDAQAQDMSPDAASAACATVYANEEYRNVRNIASSLEDQLSVKRCIDLGIDPPLQARNDWGIKPAAGVALTRMPSAACPPFESCLTVSRSSQGSVNISQESRRGASGGGGSFSFPDTGLSAPEFEGRPEPKPAHLQGGGTIFFYDNVVVTPPPESLVYSDAIENHYTDGAASGISNVYVASPPPSNPADIMTSTPVTINEDATFNFVDGGVVVLPEGFMGIIDGVTLKGGDTIVIKHAGDLKMPAGSKLYPFPDGYLGNKGTHYAWDNWVPYTGPHITLPPAQLTIEAELATCPTRCFEPVPGTSWF